MQDPPREIPPPPPPIRPSRAGILPMILGMSFVGIIGLTLLFLFDPAEHALYPACVFKKTTGYDCPGCGGLRAGHALLHGRVGQAFQLNAMVVVALPFLILFGVRSLIPGTRTRPRTTWSRLLWVWIVVGGILFFGLIRNLPVWPFGVTPM